MAECISYTHYDLPRTIDVQLSYEHAWHGLILAQDSMRGLASLLKNTTDTLAAPFTLVRSSFEALGRVRWLLEGEGAAQRVQKCGRAVSYGLQYQVKGNRDFGASEDVKQKTQRELEATREVLKEIGGPEIQMQTRTDAVSQLYAGGQSEHLGWGAVVYNHISGVSHGELWASPYRVTTGSDGNFAAVIGEDEVGPLVGGIGNVLWGYADNVMRWGRLLGQDEHVVAFWNDLQPVRKEMHKMRAPFLPPDPFTIMESIVMGLFPAMKPPAEEPGWS
jgi:hypothetical protein